MKKLARVLGFVSALTLAGLVGPAYAENCDKDNIRQTIELDRRMFNMAVSYLRNHHDKKSEQEFSGYKEETFNELIKKIQEYKKCGFGDINIYFYRGKILTSEEESK